MIDFAVMFVTQAKRNGHRSAVRWSQSQQQADADDCVCC